MTRFFSAVLFLLITLQGFAQDHKRTNVWYFGDSAGVNFNTIPPSPLMNGSMRTIEGCATVADSSGALLLYTNGATVWSRNHQVMGNGTGIGGSDDATQSSILLPNPLQENTYYIFSLYDYASTNGVKLSKIDIQLNSTQGGVITKGTPIIAPASEKITAVHHQNGVDIWILVHGFNSNIFYSYLLTQDGVKGCPVTSSIGLSHAGSGSNAQGAMKLSPSGRKIAVAIFVSQVVQVFDFDVLTGKVSSPITLNNIQQPYGVEFSPNEKFLYVTDRGKNLYQYDVSSNNESVINTSRQTIYTQSKETLGSIQQASDGKLYLANFDSTFLSVIHAPDSLGNASNFVYKGLLLNGRRSKYGLPNFISSYFFRDTLLNFDYTFHCPSNQCLFLSKNTTAQVDWTIRRTSSSGLWSYNTDSFTHTFDTGTYTVQLKSGIDSLSKNIFVGSSIILQNHDTTVCQTDSILLISNTSLHCPKWNDTINSNSMYARSNGWYRAEGWNSHNCKLVDSILVTIRPLPLSPLQKPLPDSITFCVGNTITLDADSGRNFAWHDGVQNAKRSIDTSGTFFTHFIDSNNCYRADTVKLKTYSIAKPIVELFLDSFWTNDTYTEWQWYRDGQPVNNAIQHYHKAAQNGYYQVSIKDTGSCYAISDSVLLDNVSSKEFLFSTIRISPNPVSDILTVTSVNPDVRIKQINLYTSTGVVILSSYFTDMNAIINCSRFSKGMYFIQINTEHEIITKKILIQ